MTMLACIFLLGISVGSFGLESEDFKKELERNRTYWTFKTSYMPSTYTLCYRYRKYRNYTETPLLLREKYEIYDDLNGTNRLRERTYWSVETPNDGSRASNNFLFTRMRDRQNVTYNLSYWNPTQKCFVFTFNVSGVDRMHCEVNVWDALPQNDTEVSSCLTWVNSSLTSKCSFSLSYYFENCDRPYNFTRYGITTDSY
uniref:Lipocalin n=1 Tax=Rhipicephalus zambeziensis TaxID=60191 RepID=A0A224YMY8_9ACAR